MWIENCFNLNDKWYMRKRGNEDENDLRFGSTSFNIFLFLEFIPYDFASLTLESERWDYYMFVHYNNAVIVHNFPTDSLNNYKNYSNFHYFGASL